MQGVTPTVDKNFLNIAIPSIHILFIYYFVLHIKFNMNKNATFAMLQIKKMALPFSFAQRWNM